MITSLLNALEADCARSGHGRKKWWAAQLGIPPLTLSHWLRRRQLPNGLHALAIQQQLNQNDLDRDSRKWLQYLTTLYYDNAPCPPELLTLAIPQILSVSTLDVRSVALLSALIEKQGKVDFDLPTDPKLANRLGWLSEVSGHPAPFSAYKRNGTQHLFTIGNVHAHSERFRRYFYSKQTPLGKKWMIYDTDLTSLKESFL